MDSKQVILQSKLNDLFRRDEFPFRHGGIGQAFVFVWSKSLDGRKWGGFKMVSKRKLKGRKYLLSQDHTGVINIQLLDDVFNPKRMCHSNWI